MNAANNCPECGHIHCEAELIQDDLSILVGVEYTCMGCLYEWFEARISGPDPRSSPPPL